jgi:hypothetical protein
VGDQHHKVRLRSTFCNRCQLRCHQAPDILTPLVDVVHVGTRVFKQILHRCILIEESTREQGCVTIGIHRFNLRAEVDQGAHDSQVAVTGSKI